MDYIGIDPSPENTGWARIQDGELKGYGTIQPVVREPIAVCAFDIAHSLWVALDLVDANIRRYFTIEYVEYFGNVSYQSMRRGELLDLACLCGYLYAYFFTTVVPDSIELVTPTHHKGQLPKHTIKHEMETKYGVQFSTQHEADSVWLAARAQENANMYR